MSGERALEGYVTRYDPRGWLELTNFKHGAGPEVRQNVLVFVFELESCSGSLLDASMVDSFVVISEVHAVKLWGSLGGFTTGPRSTISQFPHMRRKRARRAVDSGPRCGGISTGICSHKCILFRLWQALACGRVQSGALSSVSEAALQRVLAAVLRDVDHGAFDVSAEGEGEPVDAASDFLFYKVRAGNDQDWLCSLLPEVLNTRHLLKLAKKMCDREKSEGNSERQPGNDGFRSRVGLCGRRNKDMELYFAACIVGSLRSLDLITGRAVITDSTGEEMAVYVSGDPSRICSQDVTPAGIVGRLVLVVSQPLILCEDVDGAPTTVVILAEAGKIAVIDLDGSPAPGDIERREGLCERGADMSLLRVPVSGGRFSVAVTMSVRRALTVNPQSAPDWSSTVVGVVVFKESVVSGYAPRSLEGATADLRGMKCLLTLRDCNHSDKISVFVERAAAAEAIVGSMVCIHRCTLKWNKSQKSVYIDCDSRKGSIIDTVGVISDRVSLFRLCESSTEGKYEPCCLSRPNRSSCEKERNERIKAWRTALLESGFFGGEKDEWSRSISCGHLPPPVIALGRLEEMAALHGCFSRCVWSCRGSVTQVMSLQAFLRCDSCLCKVDPMYQIRNGAVLSVLPNVQLVCSKCPGARVSPAWQMSLFFDDGTAEIRLSAESEMVFAVLRVSCGGDRLSAIRKSVEQSLFHHGTVRAYAFEKKSLNSIPDAEGADPHGGKYDQEIQRVLLRGAERIRGADESGYATLAECEKELSRLLHSCSYSAICSVSIRQIPPFKAIVNPGAVTLAEGLESRKIKVQRSGTPDWTVDNMEPLSQFHPKIRAELLSFSVIHEKDLHTSCWDMVTAMEASL